MTNTLHLKKKTLWDLNQIAGLPIYGQVYDEYTPWNEELYGFDEIQWDTAATTIAPAPL